MDKIKECYKKVIVGGEGGVGRTTLLRRYIEGKFFADTPMTIGIQFFAKTIIIEERKVNFVFWDFAGQERQRETIKLFVKGADAAILSFDLTRPMTLENLEEWVNIFRMYNPYLPILFVGTKIDLESSIMVDDNYALQFKDKFK